MKDKVAKSISIKYHDIQAELTELREKLAAYEKTNYGDVVKELYDLRLDKRLQSETIARLTALVSLQAERIDALVDEAERAKEAHRVELTLCNIVTHKLFDRNKRLEAVAEAARDVEQWLILNKLQFTAHGKYLSAALAELDKA